MLGLASASVASCGLSRSTQVVSTPTLVEAPPPTLDDRFTRSCLIRLPAPATNADLLAQRNQLAKALADCDAARVELVELVRRP